MFTIYTQKKFRVTVENYDGKCKRVTVFAFYAAEAMAISQRNGWYPVDVKAL